MRRSLATSRTVGAGMVIDEHFADFLDEEYGDLAADAHPNHDARAVFERGRWIMRCRGCDGEWAVRDLDDGGVEFVRRMRYAHERPVDGTDLRDFVDELVALVACGEVEKALKRLTYAEQDGEPLDGPMVSLATIMLITAIGGRTTVIDAAMKWLTERVHWRET